MSKLMCSLARLNAGSRRYEVVAPKKTSEWLCCFNSNFIIIWLVKYRYQLRVLLVDVVSPSLDSRVHGVLFRCFTAAGDAYVPGLPADAPAWVAALLNRFDRLELSLVKRMDKLWNGTAQKPEHTLVPISNNVDVLPANADPPVYFPPTFGALAVLSAQQTIALLDFYQLDVPVGDDGIVIDEQIMCIADHIGARFML
jgi:hypothetical protein